MLSIVSVEFVSSYDLICGTYYQLSAVVSVIIWIMLILYVIYVEHVSSVCDLYGAYHRILLCILSMFFISAPPPCPARQCTNLCQHGYQVDNNGCATCTCIQRPGRFCDVTFSTVYISMVYYVFPSLYVEYVSSYFYICTTYQQFLSQI